MTDSKPFLRETAETATFAVTEYFRPLGTAIHFVKSRITSPKPAESTAHDQTSLEDAKAILRERLAKGRHHEKILLMQGVLSALASLLAVAISLMNAFEVGLAVVLVVLIPISIFATWAVLRLIQNREEIVELKTIRWIMKSVDEETAVRVVKQVLWGKPKRKRSPKKDQNLH